MANEESISELIDLCIPATTETPEIKCEKATGRITLVGNLIPSDPQSFFSPLLRWIKYYIESASPSMLSIELYLTFVNGSSERHLIKLFKTLEEYQQMGLSISIICHYESEDPDMHEWGKELRLAIHLPVELVEIN
ncbi:MAG: hypothetical protein PWR03_1417 [Tenuifilum sp.]|jgi:hypothetical protein|uniref:DUF1987 domain-containing protein n=1 Tax=Tenuifilum sp. TaxID=2760880 RepID=UPI0024AC3594|nr:DUF1987 domain-containing protein [Tenuifilum sp.]MDI3527234.1 hypothetical protein [Tenuifilum sp.]